MSAPGTTDLMALLERGEKLAADRATARLAQRATQLANRVEQSGVVEDTLRVVSFWLAGTRYGVPITEVLDFFKLTALTPLPGAPPHVAGLIAWRGSLLSAIDLAQCLRLPARGLEDLDVVIVARSPSGPAGLLVEQLDDIFDLPPSSLRPSSGEAWQRFITPDLVVGIDIAKVLDLIE